MTEQNLTTADADEIDDIHETDDVEGHMRRKTDDAEDAEDDAEGHFRR